MDLQGRQPPRSLSRAAAGRRHLDAANGRDRLLARLSQRTALQVSPPPAALAPSHPFPGNEVGASPPLHASRRAADRVQQRPNRGHQHRRGRSVQRRHNRRPARCRRGQFVAPDWMLYREGATGRSTPSGWISRPCGPGGAQLVIGSSGRGPHASQLCRQPQRAGGAADQSRGSVDGLGRPEVGDRGFGSGLPPVRRLTSAPAASACLTTAADRLCRGRAPVDVRPQAQDREPGPDRYVPGQGILEPAWAPGDSLIVYRTLFGGTLMLRLHHLETDTSDSLFSSGMRNLRTPDWSPDGKRIAFQLSAGDTAPNDEIWIYSLLDKRAARLGVRPRICSAPRWSPDGRWMAYGSDETGAPEVFVRPGVRIVGVAAGLNARRRIPLLAVGWTRAFLPGARWRASWRCGVMPGPRAVLSPPSVVLADATAQPNGASI